MRDIRHCLRFGPFVLDSRLGRLTRDAAIVAIEEKPLAVLALLAEADGELVTREQIAQGVWPGAPFPEVEGYVNTAIRKIRAALQDDPQSPRYVETLRGRGYRFLLPVYRRAPGPRRRRAAIGALVALALLAGTFAVVRPWAEEPSNRDPAPATAANEPYLRALALVRRADSIADLHAARSKVAAAVAARPDFVPARELAARTALSLWRGTGDAAHAEAARAEARRALALDGDSAVALAVAGALAFFHDWDESAAETAFSRALAADHDRDYVLHGAAWFELSRGRPAQAIALMHRAIDRAPLSPVLHADLGWFLYRSGDYAGALAACSTLPTEHPHPGAAECRHRALARLGRFDEALEELGVQAAETSPEKTYTRVMAAKAQSARSEGARYSYQAYLWAAAGRTPEALDALGRAVAEGDPWVQLARMTPEFAPLRGEPRYEELLERLDRPRAVPGESITLRD